MHMLPDMYHVTVIFIEQASLDHSKFGWIVQKLGIQEALSQLELLDPRIPDCIHPWIQQGMANIVSAARPGSH